MKVPIEITDLNFAWFILDEKKCVVFIDFKNTYITKRSYET